jgi:hypothetical protein
MKDIRYNCISGKIEDIGTTEACLQFNEWHDKYGIDFHFYSKHDDEIKTISLTKDEMHCLAVVMAATNSVDLKSAEIEANEMIDDSEKRRKEKEEREKLALIPNPITGYTDLNKVLELDD